MIDTLPLSLASASTEIEKEANLCKNLRNSIVDGSPTPKKFFESGDANKVLSERSMVALGELLRSAKKHFAELRSKRKLWFTPPTDSDTDDEMPPKQPLKKTKASSSGSLKSRKENSTEEDDSTCRSS